MAGQRVGGDTPRWEGALPAQALLSGQGPGRVTQLRPQGLSYSLTLPGDPSQDSWTPPQGCLTFPPPT